MVVPAVVPTAPEEVHSGGTSGAHRTKYQYQVPGSVTVVPTESTSLNKWNALSAISPLPQSTHLIILCCFKLPTTEETCSLFTPEVQNVLPGCDWHQEDCNHREQERMKYYSLADR